MKKWLLAGLIIGSFAFGQKIIVKKGSYCTGFTNIGGSFGNAAGEYFRFYDSCNINGVEYKDVALGYSWERSDNGAAGPKEYFNKKLKYSHKTYIKQGTKLEFDKNMETHLNAWGIPKTSDDNFENVGYENKIVKNYFGFKAADYKKLPFTDETK